MMWVWEKRWGGLQSGLPDALLHKPCGHLFAPVLTCQACEQDADITAMRVQLQPTAPTAPSEPARSARPARTTRLVWRSATPAGLDHRVDRWNLLIVAAVVLGCHHFDQLSRALGIGSSTLARRLQSMVESGLLRTQADRHDGRRRRYTLTDSSRDLLGYIVCLSRWAGQAHLQQASSIVPIHSCGQPFVARVACSACRQEVHAWQVQPQYRSGEPAGAASSHGRAGATARRAAAAAVEGSDS
jgi:DNA-binding HxlR family transcriptional regulator